MRPFLNVHVQSAVQAILASQRDDLANFTQSWEQAVKSEPKRWIRKIDPSLRLVLQAYSQELERLIGRKGASVEWINILEQVRLLRAATSDLLLRVQPQLRTGLPISGTGPKSLADKTYTFLVDAAYLFDSSLGGLRKRHQPDDQIVAESVATVENKRGDPD